MRTEEIYRRAAAGAPVNQDISGRRTSPARPAASGIAGDLLEHGVAAARVGVRDSSVSAGASKLWTGVGLLRRRARDRQLHPLLHESRPLGQSAQIHSRAAADRRQACGDAIDRAPRIDPAGGGGGCRARPQCVGRTARPDARPRIERTRLPALALRAADRSRRARLRLSRARFRFSASQRQHPLAHSRCARSRLWSLWSCCWDWG